MSGPETRIGILLEAINNASAQLRAVSSDLTKLSATTNGNASAAQSLTAANRELLSSFAAIPGPAGSAARQLETLSASFSKARSSGLLMSAGIIGVMAAAGAAVLAASRSVGEYQRRMDEAADLTGLTVRQVGGLEVAAARAGRSFDEIQPALFRFTRALGEAQSGNVDALKSFANLGISITDQAGQFKDTNDLLQEVAARLDRMGTAAQRNQALFDLFGRSSAAIIPVLKQHLAELADIAEREGITFSDSQQDTARQANAAWKTMEIQLKGLRNQLMITFAPLGTALVGAVNFATSRSEQENFFGTAYSKPGPAQPTIPIFGPPAPTAAETAAAEAGAKILEEQGKQLKAIEDQIAGMERLRAAKRLLIEDEISQLQKLADQAIAMDDQVVGAKALLEIQRQIAAIADKEESRGSMGALTRTPAFRGELLVPQFAQGAGITPGTGLPDLEQFIRNGKEAQKNIDQFASTLKGISSLGLTAGHALASGFGNFISSAIQGVDDLGKAFENMLVQVIAEIAAREAAKGILSLFGLQSGGTLVPAMAMGGTLPLRAQTGLMLSGVRGRDTVPVMMGKGETVISHALTDQLGRFLRDTSRREPARDAAPTIVNNNTVNVEVRTDFSNPAIMREHIADRVAGPLMEILTKGSYRRG